MSGRDAEIPANLNSCRGGKLAHEGTGSALSGRGDGHHCGQGIESMKQGPDEGVDLTAQLVDFVKVQTQFADSPHRIKVGTGSGVSES